MVSGAYSVTPSATASRGEISRVLPPHPPGVISPSSLADTGNPVIHIIHQGKGIGLFSQWRDDATLRRVYSLCSG
ncbi:hypothetical protein OIU92_32405 [Escherichia coli]|nr:hypothetical protein [Escherichia coli]